MTSKRKTEKVIIRNRFGVTTSTKKKLPAKSRPKSKRVKPEEPRGSKSVDSDRNRSIAGSDLETDS